MSRKLGIGLFVSKLLVCAITLSLSSVLVYGQAVTGTILGTVTDKSGANVPDARVVLTETQTNVSTSGQTNADGYYAFPNLTAGTYRLTVRKAGFTTFVREDIGLAANHTARVDATLQPGKVTTVVSVTSKAPLLQTDRADVSTEVNRAQLADMPLTTDRNYLGLLGLVPGVHRPSRPSSQFFNPQNTLNFDVNDTGASSSTIQIEGLGNDQDIGYQSIYVPSVEAIEAVNVSTDDYDAELGRAGGGVVNVILRSGTNNWHGSAYEFLQNSATSARNFFAYPTSSNPNPIAPVRYNLYGGTIGGPIRKDKLFIFGDYEGIENHTGTIKLVTVPSAAWRQGNFSGAPTTIYDPTTGDPSNGSGRQAFSGNVVPTTMLSPIVQKVLANVPLPNQPGLINNFSEPNMLMRNTNSFDIKTDWAPRAADRITARFSYQGADTQDPPLFNYAIGGPALFSARGKQITVQPDIEYNHTFSSSLISEFRVGLTRWNNTAKQYNYGQDVAQQYGISGINVSPFTSGFPSLDWGGATNQLVGNANALPWRRGENHYEVVNNWTKVSGTHLFKWGVDYRRTQEWILSAQGGAPTGEFKYDAAPTASRSDSKSQGGIANSFAAMLLDLPSEIDRVVVPILPSLRETNVFAFAQDKWQVTPKLTFDWGVRWEDWPMVTPANPGGFSQYDPATNQLVLAGLGGNPSNLGVKNNNRFEPRIGLAFRMDSKTVFRAGYGTTTMPPNWWGTYVGYNYPVAQVNTFTQEYPFGPAVGLTGQPIGLGTGLPHPAIAVFPSSGLISANTPLLLNSSYSNIFTPDFTVGLVQQWNAAVERSLPDRITATVMYVGNRSYGYGAQMNVNASAPGTGRAGQPLYQEFGRTAATNVVVEGPGSSFNALEIKVDRPLSKGLLFTSAFTWSKSMTCLYVDPLTEAPERCGRSSDDQTLNFVQSFMYQLPFGSQEKWLHSGVFSKVVGNWQVNGILTASTGSPMSFSAPGGTLDAVGASQYPNLLHKPKILGGVGPGQLYFDTSAFAMPAPLTYGNAGIDILDGPGFVNLDASIFRQFSITERLKGEVRLEAFNSTNTPHFKNPNTSFGNAAFGRITSALQDQRTLQFGVKLNF